MLSVTSRRSWLAEIMGRACLSSECSAECWYLSVCKFRALCSQPHASAFRHFAAILRLFERGRLYPLVHRRLSRNPPNKSLHPQLPLAFPIRCFWFHSYIFSAVHARSRGSGVSLVAEANALCPSSFRTAAHAWQPSVYSVWNWQWSLMA